MKVVVVGLQFMILQFFFDISIVLKTIAHTIIIFSFSVARLNSLRSIQVPKVFIQHNLNVKGLYEG